MGGSHPAIQELSLKLRRIGNLRYGEIDDRFRNGNGVSMKIANLRQYDPRFIAERKAGLSHGGDGDELVWNEFAGDRDRLHAVARAIDVSMQDLASHDVASPDLDDMEEAPEGRLLTALHTRRERSRKLVDKRKARALMAHGALICEACDLNFAERYGPHGDGFIEVHHTRPLHELPEGGTTRLDELALLCANCHRMIHRRRPWLTVEALRNLVRPKSSA